MSNVSLVIYGLAALWGVQMLLAFMVQHRRRTLVRLQQAEIARRGTEEQTGDTARKSGHRGTGSRCGCEAWLRTRGGKVRIGARSLGGM
ncbi:MAG: hypothetical protein B7Z55_19415 [Planctomycetales bacterium 12-60-4]|nr:MAG: hypothetical protein B7Z55_19415 [Planctomycetales bacterium 12-60-4]